MSTFTQTVIDLADRHTSLYYLGGRGPLPLGCEEDYGALHTRLGQLKRASWSQLGLTAVSGGLLGKLAPLPTDNKYWRRVMRTGSVEMFADRAWSVFAPVVADLTRRVTLEATEWQDLVSPVPRVILYPFGWSTWLSLRINGPHSLSEVASLLEKVCGEKVLTLDGEPGPTNLERFFETVSKAVRAEAFAGTRTRDRDDQEVAIVTTVLAKYGGSPALDDLDQEGRRALERIVRPYGPPSKRPVTERVYRLETTDELEYLVYDDLGRFQWVEHLLSPTGRNHQRLRCYHNNTFFSLVQAWHLQGLVDFALGVKSSAAAARELALQAAAYLEDPPYRSASLLEFLALPEVKKSLARASPPTK